MEVGSSWRRQAACSCGLSLVRYDFSEGSDYMMNLQMTQTRSKLDGRVRITQSWTIQWIINLKFGWLWPKTPKAEVQNWAKSFMGFCYPKTPGTSVWQRPKGQGLRRSETDVSAAPSALVWPRLLARVGPQTVQRKKGFGWAADNPEWRKGFPRGVSNWGLQVTGAEQRSLKCSQQKANCLQSKCH